jgi:hypothetical protein
MHDTLEDQHYLQCSFLTRVPAGTLRAKVDLQIQIVPADGTNAAFNWREYGKPRWLLSNENLHRFAGGRKGRRLLVAPWRKPRPATVTSTHWGEPAAPGCGMRTEADRAVTAQLLVEW